MRYTFTSNTWDRSEWQAIERVIAAGNLIMGKEVNEFERAFARLLGVKYAVMVNSGSSANLLAVAALCFSKRRPLAHGDEVIAPAIAWGTSLFPLQQCGLRMKFVDVDPQTFNMDVGKVASAITPATRAILAVNILGAPNDFDKLIALCDQHNLILIEDNCDGMGAVYKGKRCGTFGRCGAFSLSQGSHLSTGEGGVVVCNDEELYHLLLALRSYGSTEHLPRPNKIDHKKIDKLSEGYRFLLPGYNMRPTEIAGAVGLVQLEKLPAMLAARRRNAEQLQHLLKEVPEVQLQCSIGDSSWLSFALVLKEGLLGRREVVVEELIRQGIECRPITGGNITAHPVMAHLNHAIHGTLPQAKKIDKQGFSVANSHEDLTENLRHLRDCLVGCLAKSSVPVG